MMGFAGGFHIIPDEGLNTKLRNVSYPEYFDIDGFFQARFKMPKYELDYTTTPPGIAMWEYHDLPRSPVVYFTEYRALELAKRDYSDLTNDIPMIGSIK
jgi:hypothetical protein